MSFKIKDIKQVQWSMYHVYTFQFFVFIFIFSFQRKLLDWDLYIKTLNVDTHVLPYSFNIIEIFRFVVRLFISLYL